MIFASAVRRAGALELSVLPLNMGASVVGGCIKLRGFCIKIHSPSITQRGIFAGRFL
jgi:hypothetical protein